MPREQFHRGLQSVQDGVLEMGSMVDRQIERALQALVERDIPLAEAVVRDDAEVNRTRFHLDNMCLSLLAQQAPLASD
jgi:phosphate transport system protein